MHQSLQLPINVCSLFKPLPSLPHEAQDLLDNESVLAYAMEIEVHEGKKFIPRQGISFCPKNHSSRWISKWDDIKACNISGIKDALLSIQSDIYLSRNQIKTAWTKQNTSTTVLTYSDTYVIELVYTKTGQFLRLHDIADDSIWVHDTLEKYMMASHPLTTTDLNLIKRHTHFFCLILDERHKPQTNHDWMNRIKMLQGRLDEWKKTLPFEKDTPWLENIDFTLPSLDILKSYY